MKRIVLGAALALIAANGVTGHHEGAEGEEHGGATMPEDAMMQAMQQASTPGDAHAKLAESVGNYTAQMFIYMQPGSEPINNTMTVERMMDLDGRVLLEHWKGEAMGASFEGRGRTGFDNVSKRYWSTWTDNMSTGLLVMYGSWDEEEQTFVFEGESVHPATGKKYIVRSVGKTTAPGRETMDMFEDHGQGEYKSMSFVLQRD